MSDVQIQKYKNLLDNKNSDFTLTEQQIQFLERNKKDTILRAIPGSGKTTILSLKLKQLLTEFEDIEKIQCISYTNVTVEDIRNKCEKLLNKEHLQKIKFSTFHKFCLEYIISPFSHLYFSNNSRIYSQQFKWEKHGSDLLKAINQLNCNIAECGGYCKFCKNRWQFSRALERDRRIDYKLILDTDGNISFDKTCESFVANKPEKLHKEFLTVYLKFLKKNKLIDFNLIIYYAYILVRDFEIVSRTLNSTFNYICIDEFQDVSEIQFQLIKTLIFKRLSQDKIHWILIGDPNQSIYGFAGAKIKCMFDAKTLLQDINQENCEIMLKHSFRCSNQVFVKVRKVYNDNLSKYIDKIQGTHIDEFVNFIKDLKIDDSVIGHSGEGDIILAEAKELDEGFCFIGSDKFDTLKTYNNQKQLRLISFDNSEYINFENLLDSYKERFGYKYISLFTSYLIVKYNFTYALHDFHKSLEEYIYQLNRVIEEEELTNFKSINLSDYCLELENPIEENANMFEEYKKFHIRLSALLSIPLLEITQISDGWNESLEKYESTVTFQDFVKFLINRRTDNKSVEIKHLHKIKGLQYKEIILKTDKIPYQSTTQETVGNWVKILISDEKKDILLTEDQVLNCIEELNKIYVMLTRSESNVYILNTNNSKSIFLSSL